MIVMKMISIKRTRSLINSSLRQKRTIQVLKLNKMNKIIEHKNTPEIMGMIDKVRHLIEIQ